MKIQIPYGHQQLSFETADISCNLTKLEPQRAHVDPVRLALIAPIDSPPLRALVHTEQQVVIVTSDITRPCPSERILPYLMDELAAAGVRDEDVSIIFGLGAHRKHTKEEQVALVGPEIYTRLRCLDSDPAETVWVGQTSRGTPIEVFKPVVQADVRIVLGNVEPHYFAGYSGGSKAIVPGVCSERTIRANHALMVDRRAKSGNIDDNPVRQDIEEGAALVGIDFMVNVVLDNQKNIVVAAAGHPITAHRWACKIVDALSMTPVEKPADIVIVSAGGYPKDINMYQAQKALDNAAMAVKPGGQIIWVAQCPEGLGNPIFEQWMVGSTPEQILERIRNNFVLGGHKAAAIAQVLQRASILLVSDIPAEQVQACGMQPFADLDAAIRAALKRSPSDPVIVVIPEGSSVLPKISLETK
jgi:lactate racemase